MDNDAARIIGGVFIAVCSGLSTEAARTASDVLYRWADNQDLRPEDRRIFRIIADAATREIDDLRSENNRFDLLEAGPTLRVVGGNGVTLST